MCSPVLPSLACSTTKPLLQPVARIPSWRTAISWLVPAEPCSVIAGSGGRADRFLTKRLGFARMIRWSGLCSKSEGTNLTKEEQTMVMRHTRMLPAF
jgi:hypothetical protein